MIWTWLLESRRKLLTIPPDYRINLDEDRKEMARVLKEALPGITREDRMDELEGESWAQLAARMGGSDS